MHDPLTVAFDIRRPWRDKPSKTWPKGYRPTLITIWHKDPETDGSDDSCGWFMRIRHGDKEAFAKIVNDFAFDWDASYGGWFDSAGWPNFSTSAITLAMFRIAARHHFGSWNKANRFVRRHLLEILFFAENPTDSLHPSITNRYGVEPREDRIRSMASVVYGCVLRWSRPWYRHPRWHFWHWQFQIHPWQRFRRWLFTRCAECGGRFAYGESPVSHSWDRDKPRWFRSERGLYHDKCSCVVSARSRKDAA